MNLTCEQVRQRFSAFTDRELPPQARESVEEHLKACAHCQAELSSFQEVHNLLAEYVESFEPPPTLWKKLEDTLGLSQAKPPVVGRDISGETRNPSGFSGSKRVLSFL